MSVIICATIYNILSLLIGTFIVYLGYTLLKKPGDKSNFEVQSTWGKIVWYNAPIGGIITIFGAVIIVSSICNDKTFKASQTSESNNYKTTKTYETTHITRPNHEKPFPKNVDKIN